MKMLRVAFLVSGLVGLAAKSQAADASDFLGRWEISIANSDSTFRSCLLKLDEKKEHLEGELVWRWGSVMHLPADGAVSVGSDGLLTIKSGEWASPLILKRVGDSLEGHVTLKDGNKTVYVLGTRGEDPVKLAGTWNMLVKTKKGEKKGTLVFVKDKHGIVHGEATNDQGKKIEVSDSSVKGTALGFNVHLDDAAAGAALPRFSGEIHGDHIAGKLTRPDRSDEDEVEGTRERHLGSPVKLIAQSGLEGWRPREKSDKFRWMCEDGVLTNSDHGDVDIRSDREFQDFNLHLEFKVSKGGNSGVYLRGRYEVQIQDDFGKPVESHSNGAVYSRITPSKNACKAAETWQTYDITLIGRWVTVKLNGETIIDNQHIGGITGGAIDFHESMPGPIMLQGDHGKIWFRDVVVTPIE